MNEGRIYKNQPRLLYLLLSLAGVGFILVVTWDMLTNPYRASRTATAVMVPTLQPTLSSTVTYVPTYVVYARAVNATAEAIALTLPTPSSIPDVRADLQESRKRRYIMDIALRTAVALHPPPPNYDPQSEITPYIRLTPLPTEEPYPSTPTANGAIYDVSLQDDPIGKQHKNSNYWVGYIGGERISAYAGNQRTNADQGVVLIMMSVMEGGEPTTRIIEYTTPTQIGSVRITGEIGGQLTLQAANDSSLYFDLSTRQWVSPPPSPPLPMPSLSVPPLPTLSPGLSPVPSAPPLP